MDFKWLGGINLLLSTDFRLKTCILFLDFEKYKNIWKVSIFQLMLALLSQKTVMSMPKVSLGFKQL